MESQSQISQNFDNEITFKVVVVGNAGVGKSCLIQYYTTKEFQENYQMTIGMDFVKQKVQIDEDNSMSYHIIFKFEIQQAKQAFIRNFQIMIKQEVFKSIVKSFYSGAAGVILVYNINDQKSFDNLSDWVSEIKESASQFCVLALIGSQNDRQIELLRKISQEQGEEFIKLHHFSFFFETSAKTGNNIDNAFKQIAQQIYTTQMRKFQGMSTQSDRLSASNFIPKQQRTTITTLNSQNHQQKIEEKQKKKSGCC